MNVELSDLKQLIHEINSNKDLLKTLNEEDDLFKVGALDSMSVVQFILSIEKKYSIKISKKDISFNSFSSLKNIKTLILSKAI